MDPILKSSLLVLIVPAFAYTIFLACLATPLVQKQALYANKVHTNWWHDLDDPESFGFARNQVTPFQIETPDGERLYAWHILPSALYAKHEESLLTQKLNQLNVFNETMAYDLLTTDPKAKLIINFHGNAGHLLQNQRPFLYKSLINLSPRVHVLAFAYRGFPRSTGSPSERGLLTDGLSAVNYALTSLKMPASRIAIVGESLGTAVASGVVSSLSVDGSSSVSSSNQNNNNNNDHDDLPSLFPNLVRPVRFATLVLISPFYDLRTLLLCYRIGGVVPVLSPLAYFPGLQKFMTGFVRESWDTSRRLSSLLVSAVSSEQRQRQPQDEDQQPLDVRILHALDDPDISVEMSRMIYNAVRLSTTNRGFEPKEKVAFEGREGDVLKRLSWGDKAMFEMHLVRYGGHNRISSGPSAAMTVMKGLGLVDDA